MNVSLRPLVNPLYKIRQSLIIGQGADMRVIDQTLAPGEAVPWHIHPDTDDYVICLRGESEARELNPEKVTTLQPLQRCLIPKKRPHTTVNTSPQDCQVLTVQGPGHAQVRGV